MQHLDIGGRGCWANKVNGDINLNARQVHMPWRFWAKVALITLSVQMGTIAALAALFN
jgi:hypothetical protein